MPYPSSRSAHAFSLVTGAMLVLAGCGGGASDTPPTATAAVAPTTEVAASAVAAEAAASAASAASADLVASSVLALAKAQALGASNRPAADTPGRVSSPTTTTGAATGGSTQIATQTSATQGGVGGTGGTSSTNTSTTSTTGTSTQASPQATVIAKTTATVSTPVVFNAPLSSAPGDVIALQGENFGTSPSVYLVDASGKKLSTLSIVSTYGTGALTARLPSTATGALIVQVDNGGAVSGLVKLNAARPYHLDALQINGGGAFRLFGRNLLVAGSTPTVTIDGLAASVNTSQSNEHMLVLTAPANLKANGKPVIIVDNKNGSGPATLDRPVEAVVGKGTDPFGLGVGWGDGFSTIAGRVINAASDSRLSRKVKCDGAADDSVALQASISLASQLGGAVVQLPAGTCLYTQGLALASKVVVQGAGKGKTVLRYNAANLGVHAIAARGLDLIGLSDLSVDVAKANSETTDLQGNRRFFIKNLSITLNGGIQMYWKQNTNFAVVGTDVVQPVNERQNGPLFMGSNAGMSFIGNTITFAHGSPSIPRCSDAYLSGNRITRDVRNAMSASSVVHGLALDFAHRVAIVGNTFDVLGGPVTNKSRNDGEALLTEGGADAARTDNSGTVTSASASTLTDTFNTINVTPFTSSGDNNIPFNFGIAIVGGKGAGQTRRVVGYSGKTLNIDTPWDVIPDSGSRYATFVWGLEKALIKGNTLKDNPRGIWIYNTAAREIDIIGNSIQEGGGIFIRAEQLTTSRYFTPIYGLRIANNTVSNTTRQWASYINLNFTRRDQPDFGYAQIGIEIRQNQMTANLPNLIQPQEVRLASEGYEANMLGEGPAQALSTAQVRMLGIVMQGNSCKSCNSLLTVGPTTYGWAQTANSLLK